MNVLGVSRQGSAFAAALFRDGRLAATCELETAGDRHDPGFDVAASRACLAEAGLAATDLDHVVHAGRPFVAFDRFLRGALHDFPRGGRAFREDAIDWLAGRLWARDDLADRLGVDPAKVLAIEPALAHGAAAFYESRFTAAVVLVRADGGEWTTAATGAGDGSRLELDRELRAPQSLDGEALLETAQALHREAGGRPLCVAGFFDPAAVARLRAESGFAEIDFAPATAALAQGAALYVAHHLLGAPRGPRAALTV